MTALHRYRGLGSLFNPMVEWDNFFNHRFSPSQEDNAVCDWLPAVDVKEEATRFVIQADLPGVAPDAIKIHIAEGDLSIEGAKHTESHVNKEDYKRIERRAGCFYRRFSLPDTADLNQIQATSKNGVLEMTIPKVEKAKPRQIEVIETR